MVNKNLSQQYAITKSLLAHGADVTVQDHLGNTPLLIIYGIPRTWDESM